MKVAFDKDFDQDLKQVLAKSISKLAGEKGINNGSCSIITGNFDNKRSNVLKTTCLGDSGYMIIEPTGEKDDKIKTMFTSQPQYLNPDDEHKIRM